MPSCHHFQPPDIGKHVDHALHARTAPQRPPSSRERLSPPHTDPIMKVKRGARAVEKDGLRAIERALAAGTLPADEYRELNTALRHGRATARALGHDLGRWKRRAYAPNTAATAFCTRCSAAARRKPRERPQRYRPRHPGTLHRGQRDNLTSAPDPGTGLQYVPREQLMPTTPRLLRQTPTGPPYNESHHRTLPHRRTVPPAHRTRLHRHHPQRPLPARGLHRARPRPDQVRYASTRRPTPHSSRRRARQVRLNQQTARQRPPTNAVVGRFFRPHPPTPISNTTRGPSTPDHRPAKHSVLTPHRTPSPLLSRWGANHQRRAAHNRCQRLTLLRYEGSIDHEGRPPTRRDRSHRVPDKQAVPQPRCQADDSEAPRAFPASATARREAHPSRGPES